MKAFEYVSAQTPQSAIDLAAKDGRFIAGGIDILGEIKDAIIEPKRLVNVKSLPNSREIKPGAQAWTIGTNVTVAELAAHVTARAPILSRTRAFATFAIVGMALFQSGSALRCCKRARTWLLSVSKFTLVGTFTTEREDILSLLFYA